MVSVDISLPNLVITLNWLLTFLHIDDTCCLNVRSLSIVTPNSSIESFTEKLNWWSVFLNIIPWCFAGICDHSIDLVRGICWAYFTRDTPFQRFRIRIGGIELTSIILWRAVRFKIINRVAWCVMLMSWRRKSHLDVTFSTLISM